MRPPPARKQTGSLAETVETYTKLGLPLLGFLYVIGFVVNALYLGKYGVSPLGVLRVQYLIAGLWALAPFAVLVGTVAIFTWAVYAERQNRKLEELTAAAASRSEDWTPKPEETGSTKPTVFIHLMKLVHRYVTAGVPVLKSASQILWFVLLLGAMVLFSLRWVAEQFPLSGEPPTMTALWHLSWPIALYAIGIGVMIAALYSSTQQEGIAAKFETVATLGLSTALLIGYLGYFSAKVYPLIPSVVGGGQPIRVRLLLKQNIPGLVMQAPLLTKPYDLLVSSERTVVILDGRTSTEYSRDLFQAVIMERPEAKQR